MKSGNGRQSLIIVVAIILVIGVVGFIVSRIVSINSSSENEVIGEQVVQNNKIPENAITKDWALNMRSAVNGKVTYGSYITTKKEIKLLSLDAKEYNLPDNLLDYSDNILLRLTYSEQDFKVYDCKIINKMTGEIITDTTEENIKKLFDIEYGKSIVEKEWADSIKLSELEANTIYSYTAKETVQFPGVENDTGKNCLVYIKGKNDDKYKKEIYMGKTLEESNLWFSYNEYNSGDTYRIMYKEVTTEELLNNINTEDIVYLSKFQNGAKLTYKFEDYIYNDTDKDITLSVANEFFGEVQEEKIVIKSGEIYGFEWSIDSITMSY